MVSSTPMTTFNIGQQRFAPEPWCGKHLNESEPPLKNVYNYATRKDASDKTPMCKIAELARYHRLKHEYILLDEDGPAHKKRFTVKLVLCPGEEFEGSGPSIKKAQQHAAKVALEKCSLTPPPAKNHKSKKDPNSPAALLAQVADKLQLTVAYKDICPTKPQPQKSARHPPPPCEPPSPIPMALMNLPVSAQAQTYNTYYPPFITGPPPPLFYGTVPFDRSPPLHGVPFPVVSLPLGMPPAPPTNAAPVYFSFCHLSDGSIHNGEGYSRSEARCIAATNALTHLQPQLAELDAMVRNEIPNVGRSVSSNSSESSQTSLDEESNGDKENADDVVLESNETAAPVENDESVEVPAPDTPSNKKDNGNVKSVVSQVHEYALRLKMNVEFEVLKESGEPHKREYLLRCQLNAEGKESIEAEGKGSSKKNAKQNACAKMIEKLSGIENDPLYLASMIVMTSRKNNAAMSASKEPKRKTIIKDLKKDPLYGHHINPVSRLIQVTQSQTGAEPEFVLVSETGQNRYKVFTVEVKYDGTTLIGTGPNKRLAKRAAAETMLDHLGFVKPMPQPGKSLLKKRFSASNEDSTVVKIDVFDPNELIATPNAVVEPEAEQQPEQPVRQEIETFADVDSVLSEAEKPPSEQPAPVGASKSVDEVVLDVKPSTPNDDPIEAAPMQRRRVTFSNEVSACPPPEDANYPITSIAPLRSEVVIVSKPKKRGKDSKKTFTSEETILVASLCRQFLAYPKAAEERRGCVTQEIVDPAAPTNWTPTIIIITAKERLESLAIRFKFTVTYSDFPTDTDETGAPRHFSLVTVGLSKPVVNHGSGGSEELAHNDAAFNAIEKLAQLDAVLNNVANGNNAASVTTT